MRVFSNPSNYCFHIISLVFTQNSIFTGGVGTFDELFEVLTLKQTGKVAKDLPVVLFGKSFWNTVINWESLVNFGVVSRKDVDDLFITDDVNEAFNYLTDRLITNANFDMQGVTHNA